MSQRYTTSRHALPTASSNPPYGRCVAPIAPGRVPLRRTCMPHMYAGIPLPSRGPGGAGMELRRLNAMRSPLHAGVWAAANPRPGFEPDSGPGAPGCHGICRARSGRPTCSQSVAQCRTRASHFAHTLQGPIFGGDADLSVAGVYAATRTAQVQVARATRAIRLAIMTPRSHIQSAPCPSSTFGCVSIVQP